MVGMGENSHGQISGQFRRQMDNQNMGKLSPRWTETLMGLPLGWTCPDCPASIILNWQKFIAGWKKVQTGQTS
jgi:hypothetical protein